MTIDKRFGKKPFLPFPQINQEARRREVNEASSDRSLIIGGLATKYGLSRDRAGMLVDRLGTEKSTLENAAEELQARRASVHAVWVKATLAT